MSSQAFWRYALFGVGLFGLLSLFETKGPELDTEATPFELPLVAPDATGRLTSSLSDHEGRPLLIEVFASWCGACRRSAPTLARAHEKHKDELGFLGVSVDSTLIAAERIKRDWRVPYPVAHDADGSFARAYQVSVLPTFILVDRTGRVREVSTGAPSAGQLDEWAEQAGQ
jgi:thiol-disulfide isomerase/thioredoxin